LNQAFRSIATALLLGSASLSYAQLEGSKSDSQPVNHPVRAIQDTETPAQREARMEWWREARFGMFTASAPPTSANGS
jgi:alpha-L-fucosidase